MYIYIIYNVVKILWLYIDFKNWVHLTRVLSIINHLFFKFFNLTFYYIPDVYLFIEPKQR